MAGTIWLQKVEIDGHTVQLCQEEEGGHITGYSFSKGIYYKDPMDALPKDFKPLRVSKTQEEINAELAEIANYPCLELSDRKLRAETLDRFGIKTGLSMVDGETITTIHFPYKSAGSVVAWKTKLIDPKRFWSIGPMENVDLFGWEQAIASNSRKLFIVEGELDVPALYQVLMDKNAHTKWADREVAVVSVPNGAGAAKAAIAHKAEEITKNFQDVVLVFDNDDAGKKAAREVSRLLPDAHVVDNLPAKDAGDCLMKGFPKKLAERVLFKAKKAKNTRIVKGSTLREKARLKAEWGLSYPFKQLTDLTRGRRYGETRYWGAGVKMGKSELVNAIAEHVIVEHNNPVLIIKPEEAMVRSYQMLVSKAAGKIFHDPKIEFDEEAYDKYEPLIGDKALIIDSYQFVDWDTLKGDIRYAVLNEGVKDVIIDPITALTNQVGTSEANELLVSMTAELAAMAKDLDFGADIFCHLKAPGVGEPHERGGHVLSTQFAGSRAMMRACHYMIGMEGNKDPELPLEERNMRQLVVLEDREFGNTGIVPLYWDWKTGLFNELKSK